MKIQLKEINCFYGAKQALFDINLDYSVKGEKIVLLGPSGAGKSSLLRVFNLLALPRSGHYQLNNYQFDFAQPPTEKIIRELRQQVGMVFQQYHLWPHLTVLHNLIEAPRRLLGYSKSVAIEKGMALLERLQLLEVADRYPLNLSGGQQQRVAIARALMMEPQLLLFDEPTAALDPEITTQVAAIINELANSGITQIIVTHEVSFARKVASQFVYMEQGKIIEQGDLQQFNAPKTPQLTSYLSH